MCIFSRWDTGRGGARENVQSYRRTIFRRAVSVGSPILLARRGASGGSRAISVRSPILLSPILSTLLPSPSRFPRQNPWVLGFRFKGLGWHKSPCSRPQAGLCGGMWASLRADDTAVILLPPTLFPSLKPDDGHSQADRSVRKRRVRRRARTRTRTYTRTRTRTRTRAHIYIYIYIYIYTHTHTFVSKRTRSNTCLVFVCFRIIFIELVSGLGVRVVWKLFQHTHRAKQTNKHDQSNHAQNQAAELSSDYQQAMRDK